MLDSHPGSVSPGAHLGHVSFEDPSNQLTLGNVKSATIRNQSDTEQSESYVDHRISQDNRAARSRKNSVEITIAEKRAKFKEFSDVSFDNDQSPPSSPDINDRRKADSAGVLASRAYPSSGASATSEHVNLKRSSETSVEARLGKTNNAPSPTMPHASQENSKGARRGRTLSRTQDPMTIVLCSRGDKVT
jgi:hypothetical protein